MSVLMKTTRLIEAYIELERRQRARDLEACQIWRIVEDTVLREELE